MAKLTIESESTGAKITLIVSPSDAFRIISEFQNKYPNFLPKLSMKQFIDKWTFQR